MFRRAASGERPDILIGAQARPRRVAFANVWRDARAARRRRRAADAGDDLLQSRPSPGPARAERRPGGEDLRTALAHEIGHAIGLDHPGATGALMGFEDQGPQAGLKPGDVAGAAML